MHGRRSVKPLLRCKACDPKSGSQWTCSTSCGCRSVRLPTGGGTLVRFDFQKVAAPDGFAPSTSRVRAGRSRCLSYRVIRSANRNRAGLSPIPAACVATNTSAEFEMVGHLGAAPSVCCSGSHADGAPRFVGGRYRVTRSPIRTAQIAVFLMPGHVVSKWWSHGESHPDLRDAVASSCYWTMAPKWTRAPDSHRVTRFCRPMVRRLCLARVVMG